MRDLYRHDWDKQKVIELFGVVDWMMWLPKEEEQVFRKTLEASEEEMKMRYVTSIERLAREEGVEHGIAQGMRQGMEQGMKQGMKQGVQQGQARLLAQRLTQRFGELPAWAKERLDAASDAELQAWGGAVLSADALHAVFTAGQH